MLELPERRTEPPTESRATVHTSSAVTSADTHLTQGISTLGLIIAPDRVNGNERALT